MSRSMARVRSAKKGKDAVQEPDHNGIVARVVLRELLPHLLDPHSQLLFREEGVDATAGT